MMGLALDALLKCQGQVGAGAVVVAVADDLPNGFLYYCCTPCCFECMRLYVCVRMTALRLRQLGTANQVCVQSLLFSFAQ